MQVILSTTAGNHVWGGGRKSGRGLGGLGWGEGVWWWWWCSPAPALSSRLIVSFWLTGSLTRGGVGVWVRWGTPIPRFTYSLTHPLTHSLTHARTHSVLNLCLLRLGPRLGSRTHDWTSKYVLLSRACSAVTPTAL